MAPLAWPLGGVGPMLSSCPQCRASCLPPSCCPPACSFEQQAIIPITQINRARTCPRPRSHPGEPDHRSPAQGDQ